VALDIELGLIGNEGTYNVADLFKKEVIFHDEETEIGNGNQFEVKAYKTLTVEIITSIENTSRTITFYGKSKSGVLRLIPGIKVSGDTEYTIATSTTDTGEIWQFDIAGWEYIVMDLTAIAGGNVSVKGNVVV
jgi:hypothetical protein